MALCHTPPSWPSFQPSKVIFGFGSPSASCVIARFALLIYRAGFPAPSLLPSNFDNLRRQFPSRLNTYDYLSSHYSGHRLPKCSLRKSKTMAIISLNDPIKRN